jgi:hypothetical protein
MAVAGRMRVAAMAATAAMPAGHERSNHDRQRCRERKQQAGEDDAQLRHDEADLFKCL